MNNQFRNFIEDMDLLDSMYDEYFSYMDEVEDDDRDDDDDWYWDAYNNDYYFEDPKW